MLTFVVFGEGSNVFAFEFNYDLGILVDVYRDTLPL